MERSVLSTVIRLAIISLLVGFALNFFGIHPEDLVTSLGSTVVEIYRIVLRFLRWALEYILIGAVVVLPIWLVLFLIRLSKKKN